MNNRVVRVLLIVLGVVALLGLVAAFMMFGPPNLQARVGAPEFCVNCHEMRPQYEGFRANRFHGELESCNHCHLPNDGFVRHWFWDGVVGVRDVYKHTTGQIPPPDQIKARPRSQEWIKENCVLCHRQGSSGPATEEQPPKVDAEHGSERPWCWDCHDDIYHRPVADEDGRGSSGEQ